MLKFKSHKVVEAAKIKEIVRLGYNAGTDTEDHGLIFEDGDRVRVAFDWLAKHAPKVGGYFVRYPDGYTSWSPAAAFEQGYTKVSLDPKDGALPVAGYKPQTPASVAAVNLNKQAEEATLRILDTLDSYPGVDKRWLAIGRTHIEQGWMAVNRAIFKPGRVDLPEDAADRDHRHAGPAV